MKEVLLVFNNMTSLQSEYDSAFGSTEAGEALDQIFGNRCTKVEWLSISDDITNEVDGLDLSVSEFLSSAPVSDDGAVDSALTYPISDLQIIHEKYESSSFDEGDGDIETEALTEPDAVTETQEEMLIKKEVFNFAPRYYRKPSTNTSLKRLMKSAPTPSTSESNNSDSSIQSYIPQGKRKAGWPKGRKRKPDFPDVKPPKAPNTGYVLYLTERRKHYKHLPFHEVTKLLGNEWTKLDNSEKQIYLDRAEVDKKRYREELRSYRKSDAYQTYLKWKRTKRRQTNGTEESDIDATDEIDDEESEELYCKCCDQWFVTFHNKKEHLSGKQHWSMFNKSKQISDRSNDNSSSYSLDESSLDAAPTLPSFPVSDSTIEPPSPNIEDNMTAIMKKFVERESEVKYLKESIELLQGKHDQLKNQIGNLKTRKMELNKTMSKLKEEEKADRPSLLKYWNVTSFFVSSNNDDDRHE